MKRENRLLSKLQRTAEEWLSFGGGIAVAIMMMLTTVDVIMRKVFLNPIPGSFEIVSLIFVIVVFWGLASVQRTNGHINLSILYDRLPHRVKFFVTGVILLLSSIIFVLATLSAGRNVLWAIQVHDVILGAMPVVTWPSRLAVTIGTGFLSWRLIRQLLRLIRKGELPGRDGTDGNLPEKDLSKEALPEQETVQIKITY